MAMDTERRQAELIAQFSALAEALSSAPQLAALVHEVTSHPALFAFSELLALPALTKRRGLSPTQEYAEFMHLPRKRFTDFEGQPKSIVQDIENMVRSYIKKIYMELQDWRTQERRQRSGEE